MSNENKLVIVFHGLDLTKPPTIPQESIDRRNQLVTRLGAFESVDNQAQHDLAKAAEDAATAEARAIEASRVEVTKPLLEWQRLAMDFKNQLCDPINKAVARTKSLRFGYNSRLEKEREEAEERASAERARLQNEARKAQEAENARIIAERDRRQKEIDDAAIAAAKVATTADDARKARMTALRASMEIEEAAEAAAARAKVAAENRATETAVAVAPVTPTALKTVWKWAVTDAGKLAATSPELVNIVPKTREIDAQIKAGIRTIDGLRIWEEKELKR